MAAYENQMVLDLPNAPWNRERSYKSVWFQCPICGEDKENQLEESREQMECLTCGHSDDKEHFEI